jgi:hypothetical protein
MTVVMKDVMEKVQEMPVRASVQIHIIINNKVTCAAGLVKLKLKHRLE